jgi:hypothetical protein
VSEPRHHHQRWRFSGRPFGSSVTVECSCGWRSDRWWSRIGEVSDNPWRAHYSEHRDEDEAYRRLGRVVLHQGAGR